MSASRQLGRFRITGELGRGAMGTVRRAVDPLIGRTVAIKTVSAEHFAADPEAKVSFLREARAAGRLAHPGIVTVFDAGDEGGDVYLVMELIEGRTLRELTASGDRLPAFLVADIGVQIAEALDYAHAHGVVHRDIKPGNVMVTPDGRVKITDFGIARVDDIARTRVGAIVGSPRYMAPEQLMGREADGRSDLFSLGVLLYELIAGTNPFGNAGGSLMDLIEEVMHFEPPPPSQLNPGAPKAFDAIVARAMRKDRGARYARAAELANDLRHYKSIDRSLDPQGTVTLMLGARGGGTADPARRPRPDAPSAGHAFLDSLRELAEARLRPVDPREQADLAAARLTEEKLRGARAYLEELAASLSIVRPPVSRVYPIGDEQLAGLEVREAFAGFRARGPAEARRLEAVSLVVLCATSQQLRLEVGPDALDATEARLAGYGLRYTIRKLHDPRGELARCVLRILGELRVEFRVERDPTPGRLRIHCRNLESLGPSRFSVDAEAFGPALLDELARLLIGRENAFLGAVSREPLRTRPAS